MTLQPPPHVSFYVPALVVLRAFHGLHQLPNDAIEAGRASAWILHSDGVFREGIENPPPAKASEGSGETVADLNEEILPVGHAEEIVSSKQFDPMRKVNPN